MLQQTQVKTVIPYWERWMKALPDIASLSKAKPERIHKLWEGLGYYSRVRNLQQAAELIMAEHRGRFPTKFEKVLSLPGIGRYTAGAICSIAFNQPAPILDGNVTRVLARIFSIGGDPRERSINEKLWKIAGDFVRQAEPHCSELNQALMELGALVCTPANPGCTECPIASACTASLQGNPEVFPGRISRPTVTRRRFIAFIANQGQALFVRQRPAGVVNGYLWEFPNVEIFPGDGDLDKAAHFVLGVHGAQFEKICTIRHSITRYVISLDAYRIHTRRAEIPGDGKWMSWAQLRKLAFCSAHKKILERVGCPY